MQVKGCWRTPEADTAEVWSTSPASFVLVIGAIAIVATNGGGRGADIAFAAGLLLFALLEYLNNYHWQLEHDSAADWAYLRRNRRLRRAPLAVDLSRSRTDARGNGRRVSPR